MAFTLQQTERLRSALNAVDPDAALAAFRPDARLSRDENMVVFTTLVGEMVQFVEESDWANVAESREPRTISFFEAYRRAGRTNDFFESVGRQLAVIDGGARTTCRSRTVATNTVRRWRIQGRVCVQQGC
jgi:hypothetical protein